MKRAIALMAILLGVLSAVRAAAQAQPAMKPPVLTHFEEARYPQAERAAGRVASVVMKLSINDKGEVTQVVLVESAGAAFDAAAMDAAKKFVFAPATLDEKPAAVKIVYRYDFTLKSEAPSTAAFRGTVRDRDSKKPASGLKVELDSGESAITDDAGTFRIAVVTPGSHKITLSGASLTTVQTEEQFEPGKLLVASYDVQLANPSKPAGEPEDDLEIVVVAPPITKDVTSVEIGENEARRVPGSNGDVLKVIQNVPGVNRATAGSGDLVVWGAAPDDTRVYVDGVRIPLLYHYGGLRSVVHSDLVRSVELVPGGYGAAYGRGLGGIVTVKLLDLERGVHGSAAMDFFDASATLKVGIGDAFRGGAAFRYGILHRVIPVVTDSDVGELFPVPESMDGQAKVAFFSSPRTSFELGMMGSKDRTERVVRGADPDARRSDERSVQWGRVYGRFRTAAEDGTEVSITPWVGLDDSAQAQRYGAVVTSVADHSWVFGLRGSYRTRLVREREGWLSGVDLTVGLDGEGRRASISRSGSVGSPRREGDRSVFGRAPPDQIANDTWDGWVGSPAIFGEVEVSMFSGLLTVVPGLRVEPSFTSASRSTPAVGDTPSIGLFQQEIFLEPRLAARLRLSKRLELRAAYGLYHQPPAPEDLSAVFGNPRLQSSSAHHALAGFFVELMAGFTVDVAGFYTQSSDLAVRSPLESPLLTQALVQSGVGRSYGVQLLLRKELARGFFGWLSYSLSRSERADSPESAYRLSDYDQTHVLTALASYEIWGGIEIGARFRVTSGLPRTPVVGSYFEARTDTYQPLFGGTNSDRLPFFIQLDARLSKRFDMGPAQLEAYLDVQNVTNHDNVEELVYSSDYSAVGEIHGLPIVPVLGLRSSW